MSGEGERARSIGESLVGERVVWIDRAVADFHDESVFIIMWSGDEELPRRMSRAAFRDFIEMSKRMLDAEDRKDQRKTQRIGKRDR